MTHFVLSHEVLDRIVKAALRDGLAPPARRSLLLRGIEAQLVAQLPNKDVPADQLRSDVQSLASGQYQTIEPLGHWLRNAFQLGADGAVFAEALLALGLPAPVRSSPSPASHVPTRLEPFRLLMDNWLLQDAANVLARGPVDDETTAVGRHGLIQNVPRTAVEIQSLVDLLTAIVLRDELHVEDDWTGAWAHKTSLATLKQSGVVCPFPFRGLEGLHGTTAMVVQKVCQTDYLKRIQAENERSWAEKGRPAHSHESAVMWGGAGYLARAHLKSLTYQGHPARMSLLKETVFAKRRTHEDAGAETRAWLNERRAKLLGLAYPSPERAPAPILLPAVAFEIIRECKSPDEMLGVSFQVRDRYTPLRRWLSAFDVALQVGDPRVLREHRDVLDEAWTEAQGLIQPNAGTRTSMLTDCVLAGAQDGQAIRCRALLQSLLLAPTGGAQLDQLLALFGLEPGPLHMQVRDQLRSVWTARDS